MGRVTFGKKGRRVSVKKEPAKPEATKSPEDVVRDIRSGQQMQPGEDYREKSLAIHGLICARCAREFDASNRNLLTVHHKDGNHFNNPPDGSNWENLCVYCHEDIHSRAVLGEYLDGAAGGRESVVVYSEDAARKDSQDSLGTLGRRLCEGMKKKGEKN